MPVTLREAGARLGEQQSGRPSRRRVTIIQAGWGSSGYYPREVLERDGPRVFPAGTQMYLDHPTRAEESDRPERSVRDLAARIASTPRMEGSALVAEAEIFPVWQATIDSIAEDVGLSIRALGETQQGEAEGRTGAIVTALTEGISVDFVTKAGAGGKVGELIESARRRPIVERLQSQTAEQLRDAGRERWAADHRTYVYVEDFDPDQGWAVFCISPPEGESQYMRVAYEQTAGGVTLDAAAVEVERVVSYEPTSAPVNEAAAGRPTKEKHMSDQDTRLAALEETVRQHTSKLEETERKLTEAEQAKQAAEQRAELAEGRLDEIQAERVVREATVEVDGQKDPVSAFEGLSDRAVDRAVREALTGDLPRTEDGKLDRERLAERAVKAAKAERDYLAEHGGRGRVTGMGATQDTSVDVSDDQLAEAFKDLGMSDNAAKLAVTGR